MKTCPRCKTSKPFSDYNTSSSRYDGLQSVCRMCQSSIYKEKYYNESSGERERLRKNNKNHKLLLKNLIDEAKSTPCVDCKVQYPPYVMDLDHMPGHEKFMEVSKMASRRFNLNAIKKEIAKCEVVCANCHRIRTHNRRVE